MNEMQQHGLNAAYRFAVGPNPNVMRSERP